MEAAVPTNYSVIHNPRQNRRGGGVAICFKKALKLRIHALEISSSFECIVARSPTELGFRILLIYRPPGDGKIFLQELAHIVAGLVLEHQRWLILGDFNAWVEDELSRFGQDLLCTMNGLGFTQVIPSATHKSGHTLDLVFHVGLEVSDLKINPVTWSDHHLIQFSVATPKITTSPMELTNYRPRRGMTPQALAANLDLSAVMGACEDPSSLVRHYNRDVTAAMDIIAPLSI